MTSSINGRPGRLSPIATNTEGDTVDKKKKKKKKKKRKKDRESTEEPQVAYENTHHINDEMDI